VPWQSDVGQTLSGYDKLPQYTTQEEDIRASLRVSLDDATFTKDNRRLPRAVWGVQRKGLQTPARLTYIISDVGLLPL